MDSVSLNLTTKIEQSSFLKKFYVVQALINNSWQDVLFSRGDIFTAQKKARHYRNKNDCETRVIEIRETTSYSYEYELVAGFNKNNKKDSVL